ncbi:MAG: putative ABC transporter permease subunit, partial [Alphaproteobacteria bacterium]
VLIGALVVIYVYNFTALPIAENTPLGIVLRDVATFCNLGLAAFVVTSVAVRFVFPTISLEGRSWWILRTAPVPLGRLWWSKFWIGFGPLIVLGEVLVVLTNHLLGVNPLATAVFAATLVPLVAAIVAMGLGFGASYPRLDTQNAAHIATGFGAIVYMVSALGLVAVVVLLEAWPISRLLGFGRGAPATVGAKAGFALLAVGAALLPCAWAFVSARRRGLHALERL